MSDPRATFTGSIPQYYDDCLGKAYFGPPAAELVRRLPARPAGDVLEIACGTGQVTRRLRSHLDRSLKLVATDLVDLEHHMASLRCVECEGPMDVKVLDGD